MDKASVLEWIRTHYGKSDDPLLENIELLEIEEVCATKRLEMYDRVLPKALSYKCSRVNYAGRVIKVMPETSINDYSHIPQYIEAMREVEKVKDASKATAELLRLGGTYTNEMVLPPNRRNRKGWVTLMKEGAVRISSRRKKGGWKK